jgi:hypothetical protein
LVHKFTLFPGHQADTSYQLPALNVLAMY